MTRWHITRNRHARWCAAAWSFAMAVCALSAVTGANFPNWT